MHNNMNITPSFSPPQSFPAHSIPVWKHCLNFFLSASNAVSCPWPNVPLLLELTWRPSDIHATQWGKLDEQNRRLRWNYDAFSLFCGIGRMLLKNLGNKKTWYGCAGLTWLHPHVINYYWTPYRQNLFYFWFWGILFECCKGWLCTFYVFTNFAIFREMLMHTWMFVASKASSSRLNKRSFKRSQWVNLICTCLWTSGIEKRIFAA